MILVDGNNQFIRFYSQLGFMKIDGKNVGGMFGFLRSLYYLNQRFNDNVSVVWDGKRSSDKRKEAYTDYKKNRIAGRFDSDLFETRDEVKNILQHMTGINQYVGINVEADDVIADIVNYSYNEKFIIVSSDKDFWQLLDNEDIKILRNNKLFGLKEMKKETGCNSAKMFLLCRALSGDASDGIKGVERVGFKTALKIVKENMINDYKDIVDKNLHKDIVDRNLKLMTLGVGHLELNKNYEIYCSNKNLGDFVLWCIKYKFQSLIEVAEDFIKEGQ